ncbi:hypothetical protein [Acinetobacter dispersus]|uniref:Uncharacterized protein n=1 Tax=Acinetobacter dispersus TaxID=70348 RepID=N9L932_9GAMM|nr:hypothetical protein [Acinetobacter dispersus]ENW92787.1 hypothetical protein F904_02730 [Acinetobacter dispersus]
MGKKKNRQARLKLLNPTSSDLNGKDLAQRIKEIDAASTYINVSRVRKVIIHVCESKVPQLEKYMAKFFIKHGYKANIMD